MKITLDKNTFLGSGWSFPITFNAHNATVDMVSNDACIEQNMIMLLSTRQGERLMYPAYGHQLYQMIYEDIDETLLYRMKEHIYYIFMIHEPRVTLEDVAITFKDEKENIIYIELQYLIRETNTRTNLVYPYYLIEK